MTRPSTAPASDQEATRILDRGFWLVFAMAGVLVLLLVVSLAGRLASPAPSPSPSAAASPDASPGAFLLPPVAAPALDLTDQDARPFGLGDERGHPTFVFFGYTHCPDVCPATVGTIGLAMTALGSDVRAVFVTIDPARDTTTWMAEYVRFLPKGFAGLTGSDAQIARTAAAWDVHYAKVETGNAEGYAMSHTADVFLVDAAGLLRARFPFGTSSDAMAATVRAVVGGPAVTPAATSSLPSIAPSASATPGTALQVVVASSSVWSGPTGPVILTLAQGGAPIDDPALQASIQLQTTDGQPVGEPVTAVAIQPPGVATVSYVAELTIPSPGPWRLSATATTTAGRSTGEVALQALDPGTTPALGAPAPTAHTPTLDDVGGVARAVTTDPAPDLRLSTTSTTDALGSHRPFVLVIDSTRFRVSPACGRAIVMARYMLDRWPAVAFIHLEPYRYAVVTDTAVLEGSIDDPILTDPTAAWGIGGAPWGARSMPWVFIVDGDGLVRAKFQGVMGSAEIDVLVALVEKSS